MEKRISILGAGESGVGAAILAKQKNYAVFVSDFGGISPNYKSELSELDLEFEEGNHTYERISHAEEVIKSPGIPDTAPIISRLTNAGIPVISEIEFASRFTDAKIIAITGSNGKSTTTALINHILTEAGFSVAMGGNIGKSFARLVAAGGVEYYVIELSSFQLDGIEQFHPYISLLLNITPDHLNRYGNKMENYIRSKFRVIRNQDESGHFIFNADDENITQYLEELKPKINLYPFSLKKSDGMSGYVKGNEIQIEHKKKRFTMLINELSLQGKHNSYNTLAAGIAARILEIREGNLRESLSDFKGLEHRLEKVLKVSGVEFINDSKATNVNSTWYALESIDQPIIWIAGGVDKGNDYDCLLPLVSKKVKAVVCLGVENISLHRAFSKRVDILINTQDMKEAVKIAHHLSDKDDVVLLSPSCASFDLFENYEDRGNQFKEAVRQL